MKGLKGVEEIGEWFEGVEGWFGIEGGGEIGIMVKGEKMDDMWSVGLGDDMSKKIEGEVEYGGEIKVSVIRESGVVDYGK